MPRRKTSKRAAKARPKSLYKSDVRLDEYDENGESLDPALGGPVPAGSSSSQEGSAADGEHSREGLSVDTGVSGSKIYRCGSAVLELATANPEDITYSVKPNDIALEVECGENKATMYLSKLYQGSKGRCIEFQGAWITPNEFQAVSGRESAKDWKRSIRHRGRSLKLLFGKGVIDVHPPACRCHSCLYLQQSDGKPSVDGSGEEGKKSPSSPKSTTSKKKKFVKKSDDKDISRRDDKESQPKSDDKLRSHKSEANGEGVGPKTGSSSAESSLSSEEEDSSGDETEDDDKVAAKRARTGDLSDSKTGELKRVEAIKVKIPRNITKEETPSSSSSSSSSSDSSSDGDSDDDSDGKDDSDDDDDEDDNSEKGHVPIDPAQLNEPLFPDVKPSVYKVVPPKKKIEKEKSSSSEDDEPLAIFHRKTHPKSDEKLESAETRKGLLESSAEELIIHPDPGTRSELFTRQEPTAHQESVIHQEPQYRQEPITCQEKTAYQELITDQPLPCVSDPELTDELSPAVTCEEVKATPEHTMPEGSDAGQGFKEESEEGGSEDIEMKDGMGCVQFAKEEDMVDASLQEKERTESGAQPPAPQSDLTSPRAPNTPEEFQEETEEEEEDAKQGEEAIPRQLAPESEELVPGKGGKPASEDLQTMENEGTEPSASAAMTAVAKSPAEASDPGIPAPPPLTPATKVEKKSNKLSRLSNIIDNLRTSKEKQVLTGAEGERADTPERKQSPLPLPASKTSVPRPPSVAGEDRRGSGSEATPPPAHKHRSSPLFPGPPVPSSAHHHSPSPSQHKKSSSSSTTTSSSSAAVTSAPTPVSAAVSLGLGALPASSIFGMPAGYTPGVFGSSGSVGSKYSSSVTGTTSSSSNSTSSNKHQAAASHSSSSTRLSSSTTASSSSAIPSVLSSSAPSLVSVSPLLSASSMLSRQQEFALSLQRAMVHGLPPGDLNQAQLAQLAAFQMAQAEAALQQANLMAKAHASALSARSKTEHDLLAMSMLPWATRPELLMPYHITQQHLLAQQQQQLQQQQREREREREREQQKQQQQQREREQQKRDREQQKQQQQQFKQDQLEVRKHQQKLLEQQQQLQQKQLFMMQQQQQQQQQKDQQRKLDAVHGQYPREGMKRPYSAMAGSADQQQPRKAHTGNSEAKASRSGLPGNLPSAPSLKPRPSHTKENGKEGRPSSSSKHSALNLPNPLPVSPVAPPRMWVSCFPFAQPPPTMDLSRLSRFQAGSEDSGKHSTSSAAGSSSSSTTVASTSGSRGSAATSSSSSSSSVSAGTVGEVLDLSVKKRKLDSR